MIFSPAYIVENIMPVFFYAGLIVFAMSGGLRAIQAEMDLFGVLMVGFVTGAGGGTLRDILIGAMPVNWVVDPMPLAILFPSAMAAYGIHHIGWGQRQIFNWIDAIGMSVFCITGAALTTEMGLNPFICILMGMITATFGGLVRDILCNIVPLMLRQEIYATAAMLGSTIYVIMQMLEIDKAICALSGMVAALILRGFAIRYKFNIKGGSNEEPPQMFERSE